MDIFEAIKSRRSVRQYTAEAVSVDQIERVIDAAVLAPSAMNRQPWSFVVVNDAQRLNEMSQRVKKFALKLTPPASPFHSHLADAQFEIFHWAPTLIVICAKNEEKFSAEDCCLAAENLMLAAHALGLGTCWIGLSQPWLNQPEIKAELGIPSTLIPIAPIIIGHPRGEPPVIPREKPTIIWCH